MIRHGEEVNTAVTRLKELGACLSMDDFGTGYSSLASLHRLPFDDLKIDRSFVQRVSGREDKHADILRAIVSLARCLDMTLVAEGIETPEQLRRLRDMGCALGQGYLLSRPLTAESFAALWRERNRGNDG